MKVFCTLHEPSVKLCLTIDIKFSDPIHLLIKEIKIIAFNKNVENLQ